MQLSQFENRSFQSGFLVMLLSIFFFLNFFFSNLGFNKLLHFLFHAETSQSKKGNKDQESIQSSTTKSFLRVQI